MKTAVIFDLDGTLCNCEHRTHLVKAKKWTEFYEAARYDKVNTWCSAILDSIHATSEIFLNDISILFVTGRPETYRDLTVDWLNTHVPLILDSKSSNLYMRKEGDYRADYITKKEIYEKHIKEQYNVLFVVEDRKQVVDMWRSLGIVCLQCAEGEY